MSIEARKMSKRDVSAYRQVMLSLIKFYGSIVGACRAIDMSDCVYYQLMQDNEITVRTARKIMAGWSEMSKMKRELAA